MTGGVIGSSLRCLRACGLAGAGVLLLAGCSAFGGGSAGPAEPTPTPRNGPAETRTAIPYATVSKAQALDLYLPADDGSTVFPIVVLIHGGGFFTGSSADEADRARFLVDRGFAVAGLNYRLSGEAAFPAGVQDVKAAIRYVRANAPSWGVDPHRIAVWGESAGGYLSMMIAATAGRTTLFDDASLGNPHVSGQVAAVVSWFGPSDFGSMDEQAARAGCDSAARSHDLPDSPESRWLGAALPTIPEKVSTASVVTQVQAATAMPPVWLVHGESDCTVPPGQSQQLVEALRGKGFTATLSYVPGAGHADPKITDQATRPTVDFLRRVLNATHGS